MSDPPNTLPPVAVLREGLAAYRPRVPEPFLQALIDSATIPASVVVPIFRRGSAWRVVLVRKRPDLRRHAGDVAFPGGAANADEAPWDTALRECCEEAGIPAENLTRLGALSVIPTMTGYLVRPFVALLPGDPGPLSTRDPGEVESVFSERADWFIDPRNEHLTVKRWEGRPYPEWRHPGTGARIWGATAVIISEIMKIWTGRDVVQEAISL